MFLKRKALVIRTLNRIQRQSARHAKQIGTVMQTPKMMAELCKRLDALAKGERADSLVKGLTQVKGQRDRPLLEWLWAHREEILKFILEIIAIFSA